MDDIAAAQAIEERLRDSENLLRIASRMAGVGGWSMELPDGRIQWTDECSAIHDEPPGFSPTAREAAKYYVGKWRNRFYEGLGACARDGIPFDEEVKIITAKGRHVWLRAIGQAVRDGNGNITRMHGAFLDVTARKVAGDESETRARQQAAVAQLGQMALTGTSLAALRGEVVQLVAGAFGVEYCGMLELLPDGQALKLVAGCGWKPGLVGVASIPVEPDSLAGVTFRGKVPQILEDLADDTRFRPSPFLQAHGAASGILVVLGAEAAPWGMIGAFSVQRRQFTHDDVHFLQGVANVVTQAVNRKQAEARLQLQAAVIEKMTEGVVVADALGRITSTNPALDAMFGFERGVLIGKHISRLRNWKDPSVQEVLEQTAQRIENQATWLGEVERQKPDGTSFLTHTQISVIERDGEQHIFSVVEDITERKRDQEALRLLNAELETRVQTRTAELERARHEAEQANQAKTTFLATMSHEIRTPLNGVIGMVDVLQQTALQKHQAEMVDLIQHSADDLLTIIDDILDISRIEAGKLEVEQAPMALSGVIEKVAALAQHMAERKYVELRVHTDPALPAYVIGDAGRLRQVLFNLINNAIKFSSGQGRPGQVALHARLAERRGDQAHLELQVADNGIGMDAATVARLFSPFTQADASTTRRFGGAGLGLAISRNLLRLMGGTISVQSTPGLGSVFTIHWTCTIAQARAESAQPAMPPATGALAAPWEPATPLPLGPAGSAGAHAAATYRGQRVLVAEDNSTNQQVILRQLDLLGLSVSLASDGGQALALWRGGEFALVLTDLHMPVMDGYELAAAIRAEEGGARHVPIVALSANALKSEAERCRQAGMDDYLSKPAQLARLRGVLGKWLPAAAPAVDIRVLQALVGDNPAVVRKLLGSFQSSLRKLTAELRQACDAADAQPVVAIAHKLKSSARSVGALQLGRLCAEMEETAPTASATKLAVLMDGFEAELPAVSEALDRLLREPAVP